MSKPAEGYPDTRWVFESAEPDVGIFRDLILHACEQNTDEDEALQTAGSPIPAPGGLVNVPIVFTCPACHATHTVWEQFAAEQFATEPGGDE